MMIPTTPVQRKRERSVAGLAKPDEIEDFLEELVGFRATIGAGERGPNLFAERQRSG